MQITNKALNSTRYIICLLGLLLLAGCQSTSPDNTSNSNSVGDLLKQNELVKQQREQAQQQILDYAKADKDYKTLVSQFTQGDVTNDDYDALIRIYPLTSAYNPYGGIEVQQKEIAFAAMEQKDWNTCLQATNTILDINFTSLTGHFGAMMCHFESGNRDLGEYHNAILDGFIDAIWRSGDGRTSATAFYITSTNDLYAFVQLHGFMATGQSLVYYQQKPIDAIDIKNPETMEESVWYFDVTAQFRRGIIDDLEAR